MESINGGALSVASALNGALRAPAASQPKKHQVALHFTQRRLSVESPIMALARSSLSLFGRATQGLCPKEAQGHPSRPLLPVHWVLHGCNSNTTVWCAC
jgi:hypothetical protein